MGRNTTPHGKEAFLAYYTDVFGNDTQAVCTALEADALPIFRVQPGRADAVRVAWDAAGLSYETVPWYPQALLWPKEIAFGSPVPGYTEGWLYPMNASSLLPVLALHAKPGDRVLDACAAPGGKTLAIADTMRGEGTLIANDTSSDRRRRLQTLLGNWGVSWATLWGADAATIFKRDAEGFDRILADVPCSSEKHVWNSAPHLDAWSHSRVKQLKQRQLAITSGLFEALRPGGRLVYSTCALTPEENEHVVATLLKKKKGRAVLVPWHEAITTAETDGISLPFQPGISIHKGTSVNTTPFDPMHVNHILPGTPAYTVLPSRPTLDPMFVAVIEHAV